MYAQINTYRHSTESEVEREMEFAETNVISDQTARTIAAWYSSPRNKAITAFATGAPFDTEDLRDECERDSDMARDGYTNAMVEWINDLERILSE